jgi:hypothetical protein
VSGDTALCILNIDINKLRAHWIDEPRIGVDALRHKIPIPWSTNV